MSNHYKDTPLTLIDNYSIYLCHQLFVAEPLLYALLLLNIKIYMNSKMNNGYLLTFDGTSPSSQQNGKVFYDNNIMGEKIVANSVSYQMVGWGHSVKHLQTQGSIQTEAHSKATTLPPPQDLV